MFIFGCVNYLYCVFIWFCDVICYGKLVLVMCNFMSYFININVFSSFIYFKFINVVKMNFVQICDCYFIM